MEARRIGPSTPRLERVLDKDKGETRLAFIREALDDLIKKREAAKRKP